MPCSRALLPVLFACVAAPAVAQLQAPTTIPASAPTPTPTVVAASAPARASQACDNEKLFGDVRRFDCTMDMAQGAAAPRFVALFSNGHDDTRASLKLQVDGVDTPCAAGSKPELEGEYGNVNLLCQVPVAGLPPGPLVFTVHLRWYHAEYEGYRLDR